MEYALLDIFSVMPFLPVAINKQSGHALLLDPELEPGAAGFALRMLQRRGYVQVSADIPLQNASYHGYEHQLPRPLYLPAGDKAPLHRQAGYPRLCGFRALGRWTDRRGRSGKGFV